MKNSIRFYNLNNKDSQRFTSRALTVFAYIIVSCLFIYPCSAQPDLNSCISLYKQKKYSKAVSSFESYLSSHKRSAIANYYLALSYHQLGKLNKAKAKYSQVVILSPSSKIGIYSKNLLAKLRGTPKAVASSGKSYSTSKSSIPSRLPSKNDPISNPNFDTLPVQCTVPFTLVGKEIVVTPLVNGRPIAMEFDTGASMVYLSKNELRKLKIPIQKGPPDDYIGGAANSSKNPVWRHRVNIQLGQIIRRYHGILVHEHMYTKPLLGQEFFKGYDYTIDNKAHCIKFVKSGHQNLSASSQSVPFKFDKTDNRIMVTPTVNGRKIPMFFDTGNKSAAISFPSMNVLKKYGISVTRSEPMNIRGSSGRGRALRFNVNSFELGPIKKRNVSAVVKLDYDGSNPPALGMEVLDGCNYTVDMTRKLIHFAKQ